MPPPEIKIEIIPTQIEELLVEYQLSNKEKTTTPKTLVWLESQRGETGAKELATELEAKNMKTTLLRKKILWEGFAFELALEEIVIFVLESVALPTVIGVLSNHIFHKLRDKKKVRVVFNVKKENGYVRAEITGDPKSVSKTLHKIIDRI